MLLSHFDMANAATCRDILRPGGSQRWCKILYAIPSANVDHIQLARGPSFAPVC